MQSVLGHVGHAIIIENAYYASNYVDCAIVIESTSNYIDHTIIINSALSRDGCVKSASGHVDCIVMIESNLGYIDRVIIVDNTLGRSYYQA